ncbi:MAG TPA: uroporphyrinogen-III decarboxylase, partial [Dehalococcoidia bacterium]|nr:uroporphyrinogen-III decarboxylase [Dehalococcoidia bacterium]
MEAALAGLPVDRPPATFWGHDYLREWSPPGLAEAMLGFFRRYDWDLLKINPRATYYAEAWGCRFRPSGDPLHGPELLDKAIKSPEDLDRVEP